MNIKAIGLISKSANGDILDVFFPVINFNGEKTEIDNLDNIESSKEIIELIIRAILSASLYVGITTIELCILEHKSKDLSNNRINPQNISNFEK